MKYSKGPIPFRFASRNDRAAQPIEWQEVIELLSYDRTAAVLYAHAWAYRRNPMFYDYSAIGGDCTNFASQCLLAGGGVMNWTPETGWYYRTANDKAPAWTGVEYLGRFLLREDETPGPVATETEAGAMEPGDLVQLSNGTRFHHTPLVVAVLDGTIFVAAHSQDADWRPLDTYAFAAARYLHITGIRP